MKNINLKLGIIGFAFVFIYMLLFSKKFTYDEPYYLSNLQIVDSMGLGESFLKNMKGPAGPLYTYIHYFSLPITQGKVVLTRLINLLLSLGILFSMYKIVKKIEPEQKNVPFLFFTIPMFYPCAGMALTEIPAMFFFVSSLLLLVFIFTKEDQLTRINEIGCFVLSGLLLSIAVSGRQPYLVCIAGLTPLFLFKNRQSTKIGIALFALTTVLIPIYLFNLWGGFAPRIGGNIATREFIKPLYFFYGLGYSFMIMAILSPYFFIRPNRKIFLTYAAFLPILFMIAIKINFSFVIAYSTMERILPRFLLPFLGYLMAAFLIITGVFFMHSLFQRMYEKRDNRLFLIFALMLILLLISNIKITHLFSSRYVFQAAPLFILLASYYYKETKYTFLFHIVGVLIGVASIMNYY